MKVSSRRLLRAIFTHKGDFTQGYIPARRVFAGVEVAPFKNDAKAAVSISSDLEHNWAFRSSPAEVRNLKGANERGNVPYILKLLEEYAMPVTWATVGHLFLESCNRGAGGRAHPTMPRPRLNEQIEGDWYANDPCTNFQKDPFWYAPDLIQQIIDSNVPHEIGTHSFSHIDFSPRYSTSELVQREIEECIRVMEPFGIAPKSLVFPQNRTGYPYTKLLSDLNIVAVRHRDKKVRLSYPERMESGVYKIYESMNLRSAGHYDYLDKVKIYLEEAAKTHAAYHIWFHPSDPIALFKNEFHRIVKYLHEEREKQQIWVTTMGELAAYCEARESINLQVTRTHNQMEVVIETSLNIKKYGDPEISILIPGKTAPYKVLVGENGNLQELKQGSLFVDPQKQQLLVNVTASSKIVKLLF